MTRGYITFALFFSSLFSLDSTGFPGGEELAESEKIFLGAQILRENGVPIAEAQALLYPLPDGLEGDPAELDDGTAAEPAGRALSDAEGFVHLTVPRPGRWKLVARAPGFVPVEYRIAPLLGSTELAPLYLRRDLGLKVRVVDEESRPIAGARVRVRELAPPEARIVPHPRRGLSDDTGALTLPKAAGEEVCIEARAPGWKLATMRTKGSDSKVRIVMVRDAGVFGRIRDGEERPVAGAEIRLHPLFEERSSRSTLPEDLVATSETNGYFEIPRPAAGRYNLVAKSAGYAPTWVPAVSITADRGSTDVGTIVLVAGVRIEARVLDPRGRGIAGAEIRVVSPTKLGREGAFGREPDLADAITDADGRVWIEDLRPGRQVGLKVQRAGFAPLSISGVEAPLPEQLTLTLTPAAKISGVVLEKSGDPLAGARLSLRSGQQPSVAGAGAFQFRSHHRATSDGEGRFELEDVTPGSWALLARAPGFQSGEVSGLEITAGRDLEGIEILLNAGAVLTGRVTDPTGEGVIEATVQLLAQDPGDRGHGRSALTDTEGFYRLEGLPPGASSIAVLHPTYPRAVRDLRIPEGESVFDVQLEHGWELSGRVVDPAGLPLAAARVDVVASSTLLAAARDALTASDGTFAIPGLAAGSYQLRASKPGYAAGETEDPVRVEGAPVFGLELRLTSGSHVTGRIVGLERDQLPGVVVDAHREGSSIFAGPVKVDVAGVYRLKDLAPGPWRIAATLGSRRAAARVFLEEGTPEAGLDLQFGGGLTLLGEIRHRGEGMSGARASLEGHDRPAHVSAVADHRGRFRLEGLEAGRYTLRIFDAASYLSHRQDLLLVQDESVSIELASARLSGFVLDGSDLRPVEGARVSWRAESEAIAGAPARWEARTDTDGFFSLDGVAAGTYRLLVRRKGYATGEWTLEVEGGATVDGLRMLLQATEGLTLEVSMPTGRPADVVWLAALTADGRVVHSGRFPTRENGRIHLTELPSGEWELIVSAEGTAVTSRFLRLAGDGARSAAEPVDIRLQRSAGLAVTVPELAASDPGAYLTVTDLAGRLFRAIGSRGTLSERWQMRAGQVKLRGLAPGDWSLTVETADGRRWESRATTAAGQTTEILLD